MMAYLFGFTEGLCEIQSHQIVPETRGLDGFQGLFGGAGGIRPNLSNRAASIKGFKPTSGTGLMLSGYLSAQT